MDSFYILIILYSKTVPFFNIKILTAITFYQITNFNAMLIYNYRINRDSIFHFFYL